MKIEKQIEKLGLRFGYDRKHKKWYLEYEQQYHRGLGEWGIQRDLTLYGKSERIDGIDIEYERHCLPKGCSKANALNEVLIWLENNQWFSLANDVKDFS